MELTKKEGMTYVDLDFNQEFLWKTEPNGHIGESISIWEALSIHFSKHSMHMQ